MIKHHIKEEFLALMERDIRKFRRPFGFLPEILEYISESEHQDGVEHWMHFVNGAEARKDFYRYVHGKE